MDHPVLANEVISQKDTVYFDPNLKEDTNVQHLFHENLILQQHVGQSIKNI